MTAALDLFALDPEQPEGKCRAGLHTVTGRDHARPMRLPDGQLVHVCIYCWQAADLAYLRSLGTPVGIINTRARCHAQQRNRLLIDDVAVARVAAGGDSHRILTPRERQAVVRLMTDRGASAAEIQARTGINARVATRLRSAPVGQGMRDWERRLYDHLRTADLTSVRPGTGAQRPAAA